MRSWQQAVVLAVLTVLVYAASLGNGFVYDDHVYVQQNPQVHGGPLAEIFRKSFPPQNPDQGLFRPLLVLSYRIDARLWGLNDAAGGFGFHVTNLLLHVGCVLLAWSLLRRLAFGPWTAAAAALLFAFHPAASEAVNWIAGRAELGAAFFGLLSLRLLLCDSPARRWLAPLAWFAALGFKESAAVIPLLALLLRLFQRESFPASTRATNAGLAAAMVAAAGLYLGLRAAALPSLTPQLTPFDSSGERLGTALIVLWRDLRYAFWPSPLSVYHQVTLAKGLGDGRALAALVAWIVLIAALWCGRSRPLVKLWGFGLLWWLAVLLPVSNLLLPIGTTFAERFLYWPALFLYAAFAETLRRILLSRQADPRIAKAWASAVLALILILCGATTWSRARVWHDDVALWEAALSCYPGQLAPLTLYASALEQAGRSEEAMKCLKEAESKIQSLPPKYRSVFLPNFELLRHNVQVSMDKRSYGAELESARVLYQRGSVKEAIKALELLSSKYPQFGEAEECLGDIYVRLNNDMGALQHYQKAALREDLGLGNHAALLKKMAAELARLGMTHEAVDLYEKSVVVDPSDPLVYFDLGTLWNQLGQLDRSIYFFEQAVKVKPDFTPAHLNLASCYFTKGRLAEARTEVQAVLRAEPGNRQAEKLLRQIVKKSS